MSGSLNKVMIIGNLGADPEVRHLPSGSSVANISVATSEKWNDKQTGQPQERTEWHRVSLFNRLAEVAGEYLRKGSKVYIEGSLHTRKWTDNNGVEKYSTDIKCTTMTMLGSPPGAQGQQQGYSQPAQQPAYGQQQAPQQPAYGQQQAPQQQSRAPAQGQPPAQHYQQPQSQPPAQHQAPAGQNGSQNGPPQHQPVDPNGQAFADDFDDDIPF